MQEHERLIEYIRDKEPVYTLKQYRVYEYDSESDVVYDPLFSDFIFVRVTSRNVINPYRRDYHRTDGPAIVTRYNDFSWYYNNTFVTFDQWAMLTNKSDQEKIKLMFRYYRDDSVC